MKRIALLIVFFIIIGCSSDENQSNNNNSIIGTWEYFKVRSFPAGTTITGQEELFNYPHECPTKKAYLRFGNGGSLKDAFYYDDCEEEISLGNYILNDFILSLNFTQGYSEMEGDWEVLVLNNTNLIIAAPNPPINPVEIDVFNLRKIQ